MDQITIAWWMWIVAGLGLMALEAFVPSGFYLFFLGLAAIGTGSLTWLGVLSTLFYQGIAALLLMGAVVALRKPVVAKLKLTPQTEVDSIAGQMATALETMAPRGAGRVELRGAAWSALNVGEAEIASRGRCRVERVDGLTLEVRAS
jgi:inner membrane protein